MNKRGDRQISFTLLVTIIAIAGFVIVFYALTKLNQGDNSDEACRFSILTRASVPSQAESLIPLKCTTNKICLTLGDDCPQFIAEKNVQKIKVKSAEDIEMVTANAMYDCWSMTGEGKLGIFSGRKLDFIQDLYQVPATHPMCIICSRVALSPNLQNSDILKEIKLRDYLENKKVPGSDKTYLQTFTDYEVNSYPLAFTKNLSEDITSKKSSEIAFVFSQIVISGDTSLQQAITATGGTFLVGSAGKSVVTTLTPFKIAKKFVGNLIGPLVLIDTAIQGTAAYFQAEENKMLAAGYCGSFTSTKEEASRGCSLVTPVDWNNKEAINKLCSGGVEGTL